MTYLAVLDGDRSNWHLERTTLLDALRRDWPAAEESLPGRGQAQSEVRDVSWTYASDDEEIEAYAHKDGTCLYIDGGLRLSAAFAIWYRSLIPERVDVTFCDDSHSFNVAIGADSTAQDLMNAAE